MPSQNSIAEYHLALTVQCPLPPIGCSSPPGDPCKRRDERGRRVPLGDYRVHRPRLDKARNDAQLPFDESRAAATRMDRL